MTTAQSAGYSGRPLAKKLGFKAGMRVLTRGAPESYLELLKPVPSGVEFVSKASGRIDMVHLFASRASVLAKELAQLRTALKPDVAVWVSWPKRASKVPTDITEDVIRSLALPLGLVDIKVCAVSEIWSGLKLVVRKGLRPS